MKSLLISLGLLTSIATWAQKNIFLNIEPLFGTQAFALNQNFIGNDGIAVNIEHFNYYLSDIKLFHDNGLQTNLLTDIWLLTPEQHSLYLGNLNINQIDSINFTVGVAKRYNTQTGAQAQDISTYPDTNALSFQSPSMYWGWAFGYMHMIVGGKADSNTMAFQILILKCTTLATTTSKVSRCPAFKPIRAIKLTSTIFAMSTAGCSKCRFQV